MRRFIQVVLLTCLLLALAEPAGAEHRIALVIGNGAYKAAPLKNPVNDARDMAASLKRLGFDVTLLTDAGQQQMDAAVREFGLKLRQGGAGLFYYAGHGLQVAGENYLVPVNANIQTESDVRYTCLPAGMVLGKMEDARNDLNIIILDACRNNPFARSFRSTEQGLAKMDAPTGSLISYATAPGSVASDGQGKNGLFTQHLLRNMATPGLPITEVFMRVRQSVVAETKRKQVPWEASSLIGQFYFSGTAANQPPLPATVAAVSPVPATAPAKPLDLKAEKKRVAEEAARLRREQQELAQLQALGAEKDRLEAERQKVEQAKLLALAPRPKQPPQAQQAVPVHPESSLEGGYRLVGELFSYSPVEAMVQFAFDGTDLTGSASGHFGPHTFTGKVQEIELGKGVLQFVIVSKPVFMQERYYRFTCSVSPGFDTLTVVSVEARNADEPNFDGALRKLQSGHFVRVAQRPKQAPQAKAHAAQFAQLARAGLPDARAYFEQAVQARPNDADARAGLAIALVFSGREADAKYQFQRLSESGAQTAGVRLAKGLLLGLEGNADANYQLNRAQEEGADRALALLCQAVVADRKGEMERGQKLMESYAALVPEVERGEHVKILDKNLNLAGNMVGSFKWVMPPDYEGGYGKLDIVFRRAGSGLAAAATGKFWAFSGDITVQDVQLKGKTLMFTLKVYKVLFGSLDDASTYRFTCDLSGSLDVIPVPVVEWVPGRDGKFVTRRDYANTRLERQL